MSFVQELKFGVKNHRNLIYAVFALLVLISPVVAQFYTPDIELSDFIPIQVPRLMKQDNGQAKSKVPDYLYNFLSEEDQKNLETYGEYLEYLSDEDLQMLETYNEYLQQLTDPNQQSSKAYDYFLNCWNPVEETISVSSEELPNFRESLQSFFFKDWVKKPSYSLEVEPDEEVESISTSDDHKIETTTRVRKDNCELVDTTIISENKEIHQRSVITEDSEITQISEISGRPRIQLIEPDFSGFDDIRIPIHSNEEGGKGAGQADLEWVTKTIDVEIGYKLSLSNIKEDLNFTIKNFVKFQAWAMFIVTFRFVFPVRLIIEYPAEVFEGQTYDFKVTLIPLDLPDYPEFKIKVLLWAGVRLDIKLLKLQVVCKPRWYWDIFKWKWRKTKKKFCGLSLSPVWKNVFYLPLVPMHSFEINDTFQTPLAGESATIDLHRGMCKVEDIGVIEGGDIDLLPIIAEKAPHPVIKIVAEVLSILMKLGLSLGWLDVFGNAVTGELAVSAGDSPKSKNTASWNHSGEVNTLEFGIPHEAGEYLGLSFDKMIFHARKITWMPEFFISFKDIDLKSVLDFFLSKWKKNFKWPEWLPNPKLLRLNEWFGTFRTPISKIDLGKNIPSRHSYEIYKLASKIVSADVYDFLMDVEEITPVGGQGALATVNTYDQMYEITLQNPAGRYDVIELEVQGLPEGYTATFDRAKPVYSIDSFPTTVDLIVSPPEYIKASPGVKTFNVVATSQAKRSLNVPDPTMTKSATLTVPSTSDFSLNVDLGTETAKTIQINYGDYIPIRFLGENLGNQNDTITVNATLYSLDSTLRSWENSYAVDPYGSGSSQYYSGGYGFTYDRADLYPSPGVYALDIEATSQRSPTNIKKERLALNFTTHYDLETSITPESTTMFANFGTNFTFTLKNMGHTVDNYTLTSSGWDDYITFLTGNKILDLAPNDTEEIIVALKIPKSEVNDTDAGVYDFRIAALSDGSGGAIFSSTDVSVNILEPDYVPPGIIYVDTDKSAWGFEYPYSTEFTYGPSWKAIDNWPDTYSIYINSTTPYDTGTWINDSPIFVPVTGPTNALDEGIYNITVTYNDTSGNEATEQIWITINPPDATIPIVTPLSDNDSVPWNYADENVIPLVWNCTEEYLLNISIYKYCIYAGGDMGEFSLTQDNLEVLLDPDIEHNFIVTFYVPESELALPEAPFPYDMNITLLVQDGGGNSASASIFITVAAPDIVPPELTISPDDYIIAYLNYGGSFNFTATDTYPAKYELWINSTLGQNGTWKSGVPVIFQVEELNLPVGANDLELYVYDLVGNDISTKCILTLHDIDPPTLMADPGDLIVNEHTLMEIEIPYWQLHDFDPRPGTYRIYQDSVLVKKGTWTIGNCSIPVPIRNLTAGSYNIKAEFRDATGNMIPSSFDVTIKDVLAPYIWPHDPIYYEPLYTASWFEFFISEPHLESYRLFRNGTSIAEGTLSEDFPFIFVSLADLSTGYYTYTVEVTDESGNIGTELVEVHVTDYTPPFIIRPPDLVFSEGTTGHSILWEIIEANPHNYSLYLNDQLISSGTLTNMNMSISVDTLELGLHKYILVVYCQFGFSHAASCYVVVVDITTPTLSQVFDCRFVEGDPNAKVVWKAYDLHPSSYTIKHNGTTIITETWTGTDITLPLIGWFAGTHNVELIVSDTSGNTATDEVKLKIIKKESYTTLKGPSSAPGFILMYTIMVFIILTPIKFRLKKRK
ncbi:MAG: hypothetical protein ACFFB5_10910 [Promethearchaeota archaeon]